VIVSAGSTNPAKVEGIRLALSKYFSAIEVRPVDATSVSRTQPRGLEQMAEGATARAKYALATAGGELGVGVEAGIFSVAGVYFDNQVAAIADVSGKVSLGHSAGYTLPKEDIEALFKEGSELERWAEGVSGIDRVGDKGGVIQFLTRGRMTRTDLTEQSVVAAMVPRLHPVLYRF
jgi:inosine/xanthosine triphosphatase